MSAACTSCGKRFGVWDRLIRGRKLCDACEQGQAEEAAREAAERTAARAEYERVIAQAARPGADLEAIQQEMAALATRSGFSESELRARHIQAFRAYLEETLADDILSEAEEQRMREVGGLLGIDQRTLEVDCRDLLMRLFVASVNDGRIPALPEARVLLQPGETAHLEVQASLLKEVVQREWVGRSQGVSFRIMKGVRYHVGGVRGQSVVVGTYLDTDDSGVLTVTSKRAVFTGRRRSIEILYPKLLNLQMFSDGIQFHVSNRKVAPLFQVDPGASDMVAATINAVFQRATAPASKTAVIERKPRSTREKTRAALPPAAVLMDEYEVVGESYHNVDGSDRQEIIDRCHVGEGISLVREPQNTRDSNAVAVCTLAGEQIGYLSRVDAMDVAPVLDHGASYRATIKKIVGGVEGKPSRGVVLSVDWGR